MALRTLDDFNLKNKNILIRVDMNVPIHNGQVTDSTRLSRAVPTILEVLEKGGICYLAIMNGNIHIDTYQNIFIF